MQRDDRDRDHGERPLPRNYQDPPARLQEVRPAKSEEHDRTVSLRGRTNPQRLVKACLSPRPVLLFIGVTSCVPTVRLLGARPALPHLLQWPSLQCTLHLSMVAPSQFWTHGCALSSSQPHASRPIARSLLPGSGCRSGTEFMPVPPGGCGHESSGGSE